MEVVQAGLVPSTAPGGSPVVVGLRTTERFGPPECRLEILAARRTVAVAVREEIGRLMRLRDVFRGQVLSAAARLLTHGTARRRIPCGQPPPRPVTDPPTAQTAIVEGK